MADLGDKWIVEAYCASTFAGENDERNEHHG
jgi:hypothetical protein